MSARRALAIRWAGRACQSHAPVALDGLGVAEAARALREIPALDDVRAWRTAGELARRHKVALSLDAEARQAALRAPERTAGTARAWVCLHLVDVVAGAVASYLYDEPCIDEDDAAVVRAWIADCARTLALLAGGEARAREEDELEAAEVGAVEGAPEPGA